MHIDTYMSVCFHSEIHRRWWRWCHIKASISLQPLVTTSLVDSLFSVSLTGEIKKHCWGVFNTSTIWANVCLVICSYRIPSLATVCALLSVQVDKSANRKMQIVSNYWNVCEKRKEFYFQLLLRYLFENVVKWRSAFFPHTIPSPRELITHLTKAKIISKDLFGRFHAAYLIWMPRKKSDFCLMFSLQLSVSLSSAWMIIAVNRKWAARKLFSNRLSTTVYDFNWSENNWQ